MGRFINPFTDMGFKRIFGQEASKDLLIDFLNDLLVGEKQMTIAIARNLKLANIDDAVIVRTTGLSIEEIENL